jgi:fucose permease
VGTAVQRLGIRATLLVGSLCYLLCYAVLAVRPPFLVFAVVQVVGGIGSGLLESVLNAYLTDLPAATVRLNRLHAFFGVGALTGPLLASWMLGFLPWTAVNLVLAVASLPLLVGFLFAYPARSSRTVDVQPGTAPQPADGVASAPESGSLLVAVLREPAVLLGATFLTVYVGLEVAMGTWGFSYLVEERGLEDLLAGYAVSGYWLGLTLGRFLISPIAGRIGLTTVGTSYACLVGVAISSVVIWLVPVTVVACAGMALLGFCLGPLFPTMMAVAPDLTSARLVASAIGLMNGLSVVGGAGLPWLAGAVAQAVGVWTLLPLVLVLGCVQLAVWWRLSRYLTVRATPAPAAAVVAG